MKIIQYQVLLNRMTGRSFINKRREVEYNTDEKYLLSPSIVYQMMEEVFGLSSQAEELVYLVTLNCRCKMIGIFKVSQGTANMALIGVREVYLRALLIGASYIIIVHNHPSQDTKPSKEDISVTRRLKEAGDLLGLHFTDHIIIGNGYYSFRESGQL